MNDENLAQSMNGRSNLRSPIFSCWVHPNRSSFAEQFAAEFVGKRQASVNPLLQALRLELRKELALAPLDNGIKILRIARKS